MSMLIITAQYIFTLLMLPIIHGFAQAVVLMGLYPQQRDTIQTLGQNPYQRN